MFETESDLHGVVDILYYVYLDDILKHWINM